MQTDGVSDRFRLVFKMRGKLMIIPMLFLLLWTGWEVENDLLVFGLGGAFFCAGVALRVWAQVHLHYRLPDPMALTVSGPFARVRNPIYIANTLILLGLCFMSEVMVLAPAVLLYCMLVYTYVVRHEESALIGKYGEPYRQYCQRVPRWLPRWSSRPHQIQFEPMKYLLPSLRIEAYSLLLLVPFVAKELIH